MNIVAVMSTSRKYSNKYDGKNDAGYGRIGGIVKAKRAGRQMLEERRARRSGRAEGAAMAKKERNADG